MKRLLLMLLLVPGLAVVAQEPSYDKIFFENNPMKGQYFYSKVEYQSPSWVYNIKNKLPTSDTMFFTPGNSLMLRYTSKPRGKWEARLLYKSVRGQDHLSDAKNISFFIRNDTSLTDLSHLPAIAIGNKHNISRYIRLTKYVKELNNQWQRVILPLEDFMLPDTVLQNVDFVSFRQDAEDGNEHTLFLDQVEFVDEINAENPSSPELISATGYGKHIDLTWKAIKDPTIKYVKVYRSIDRNNFYPVGLQSPNISRYADFVDTTGSKYYYRITLLNTNYKESEPSEIIGGATRRLSHDELLDMVQEAHFRYYWEGAEENSGLALENIHGRRHMIATGASGFGMMALITGAERKYISRQQLVERFTKITSFLEKADRFHGAFPHFLNGNTGRVVPFFGNRDNGADLVETSFLFQGLLTAREYFDAKNPAEKKIIDRIDTLWRAVEWKWFRKEPDSKFLYWHWSPDQAWIINHKLIGWNETLITYLMAIASPTHAVPPGLYYTGWSSQSEEAQRYRSGWGQTKDGSLYKNGNTYFGIPLKVGVSNGGPLFFIHYSFLGLDPHKFSDRYTNYFDNNRNIALINYRYCVENPEGHQGYGPAAWGLTASDGLWSYQADEPVMHQDHGKITPTGALASFPYTPAQSMAALQNYYYNYGKFAWGEYGFYDAFNLDENWRSEIFMGLNQAPIVVMIENYRSGLLWKLFMMNKDVKRAVNAVQR